MTKSFKKFLEESEGDKHPFMTSFGDMFNVRPEDWSRDALRSTFTQMGLGSNLLTYKVVGYKKDKEGRITHALVKPLSMDKTYKDDDGKLSRVPSPGELKEKLIPIEDLDELMQQDFKSQSQPM